MRLQRTLLSQGFNLSRFRSLFTFVDSQAAFGYRRLHPEFPFCLWPTTGRNRTRALLCFSLRIQIDY